MSGGIIGVSGSIHPQLHPVLPAPAQLPAHHASTVTPLTKHTHSHPLSAQSHSALTPHIHIFTLTTSLIHPSLALTPHIFTLTTNSLIHPSLAAHSHSPPPLTSTLTNSPYPFEHVLKSDTLGGLTSGWGYLSIKGRWIVFSSYSYTNTAQY